jgi:hypothetical protein
MSVSDKLNQERKDPAKTTSTPDPGVQQTWINSH